MRRGAFPLATAAIFFLLWEGIWFLAGGIGFHHSWEVFGFLTKQLGSLEFWGALVVTMVLTIAGLLLGLIVAVAGGLVIGPHHFIERSSRGSLYFARAIPSVALIPLLMAAVGSRVGLVVILVTWLVAIKLVLFVVRGVRDVDSRLEDQATMLHLPGLSKALFLRIPAASAQIMTGVRLTVNRAYGAVILGGLLAGTPGIGELIRVARMNGDSLSVLGYAVLAGMVGVLFFWGFGKLEQAFVRWRPVS